MKSDVKILMIHQGAELYGSDRSFVSSVNTLSMEFGKDCIDVILPQEGSITRELDVNNIFYRPDGFLRKNSLKSNPFSFAYKLFKETYYLFKIFKKYDYIYINTIVCFSAIAASKLGLKFKKTTVHVREIPVGVMMKFFKGFLSARKCHVIYNSESTKGAFGLPGDVVLNGVKPMIPNLTKNEFNGQSKRKYNNYLIVGRINSWKGQDFFLDTVSQIMPKLEIQIVGGVFEDQHHYLTKIQSIAQKYQMHVEFFDFANNPKKHFEWADFVVVPSILPEPFGRVATEAMSAGKPVIAASHGGLVEIVDDSENGFLFNPCDKDDLLNVITKCQNISAAEYEILSVNALNKFNTIFSETAYQKTFLRLLKDKIACN